MISSSVVRGAFVAMMIAFGATASASASEKIKIGVPGKNYWPTVVSQIALSEGYFDAAGVEAELSVFKSGAEAFESLAADVNELVIGVPVLVARAREKGVNARVVAAGTEGYLGWHLMVANDSPINSVEELTGKKVAITAAGSGSDVLATWLASKYGITFDKLPVGGSGLVPNLLSGNVDAAMVYSPPSFTLLENGEARSLYRMSEGVPANANTAWVASEKAIEENPEGIQRALNAFYGALQMMKNDRTRAIELIVSHSELTPEIAALEYDETISNTVGDGIIVRETIQQAIDLGKSVGIETETPIEDIVTERFVPEPVMIQ